MEGIIKYLCISPCQKLTVGQCKGGDTHPPLKTQRLEQIINKKSEKLKKEYEKFDANFLLILFDYLDDSSRQCLDIELNKLNKIKTKEFDSVFLYEKFYYPVKKLNKKSPPQIFKKNEHSFNDALKSK